MTDGSPAVSTASAVSPDSGEHWSAEGAWPVAEGIYRIPLPLPTDGLKAINVYVIEMNDGLALIDGGWAIDVARSQLERCLQGLGYGPSHIRRFLVTHVHRDHYTMASILGHEFSASVALGFAEKPALDLINDRDRPEDISFARALTAAGADDIAEEWSRAGRPPMDPALWRYPDTWLDGDQRIEVGTRTLDAVHTPGHTPGHFVFADGSDRLLFAGDHILPTITPSIGFSLPATPNPLGDFMASLTKVRALPDLTVLPAHGPVAPSSHARIDELLAHHESRLEKCLAAITSSATARQVARELAWTRRETSLDELDVFNRGLAVMETKAHLDLLVAQGGAVASVVAGVTFYARLKGNCR